LLKTGEIRNRYRTAILVSIPALLVLLVGIGLFPQAYASSAQQVVGNCPNTSPISPCGTFSCVDGPISIPAIILINATRSAGVVSGTFSILGFIAPAALLVVKSGTINVLRFDKDHDSFTLKGIETSEIGCAFPQTLPTTVTISGNCGSSVTVTYRAANGEAAKFVANVACV
jgi:hypothetical protein